ncbi:MAG: two-component system, NarL family, sensor kinase [Solirubrobacterales bacterium]|jgi:signal transduction histidine kinase|nr:two-component system, NarL family, sensor kinase [Solirubrobacterales bacterium]
MVAIARPRCYKDGVTERQGEVEPRPRQSLRARLSGPVAQFALAGLLAVVAIGAAAFLLIHRAGNEEALRDAKRVTATAGAGIIEPALTPAMVRGNPRALAKLDRIVRERILGRDGIVRVKIWDPSSRIIYSDDPRLIGDRFDLGADEIEILRNGGVKAAQTDLSQPENRYETAGVDLLEVYLAIDSPTGGPLLFETYTRSSFVASGGRRIWSTLAPVLVGALALLAILLLPLAARLAGRLRRGQREREALLQRAVDSSDAERRRIAQDLHDGVVQDLAGSSYALAAAAREPTRSEEDRRELAELATRLRGSVRSLRGLLIEIYPPDLHREGLRSALADVVAKLDPSELTTDLEIADDLELPDRTEALFFRGAQEALRNVAAHAEASHVLVRIDRHDGVARLEVRDDGRGFDAGGESTNGHFGLRTLRDLADDAGGRLAVESAPGRGTTVVIEVPLG